MKLVVARTVAAPADEVWSALTDWERQGEWIPATTVWVTGPGGAHAVGSRIEAWTGVGRVGFLDTMVITAWDPPWRCEVLHTGRVLRGPGTFSVRPLAAGRSRVTWEEDVALPFGLLGRALSVLLAPLARLALWLALGRFSRDVRRSRQGGH